MKTLATFIGGLAIGGVYASMWWSGVAELQILATIIGTLGFLFGTAALLIYGFGQGD